MQMDAKPENSDCDQRRDIIHPTEVTRTPATRTATRDNNKNSNKNSNRNSNRKSDSESSCDTSVAEDPRGRNTSCDQNRPQLAPRHPDRTRQDDHQAREGEIHSERCEEDTYCHRKSHREGRARIQDSPTPTADPSHNMFKITGSKVAASIKKKGVSTILNKSFSAARADAVSRGDSWRNRDVATHAASAPPQSNNQPDGMSVDAQQHASRDSKPSAVIFQRHKTPATVEELQRTASDPLDFLMLLHMEHPMSNVQQQPELAPAPQERDNSLDAMQTSSHNTPQPRPHDGIARMNSIHSTGTDLSFSVHERTCLARNPADEANQRDVCTDNELLTLWGTFIRTSPFSFDMSEGTAADQGEASSLDASVSSLSLNEITRRDDTRDGDGRGGGATYLQFSSFGSPPTEQRLDGASTPAMFLANRDVPMQVPFPPFASAQIPYSQQACGQSPNGTNIDAASDCTPSGYVCERDVKMNDVIGGAGTKANKHQGNQIYLEAVSSKLGAYRATCMEREKRKIVRDIQQTICDGGGRFLRKVRGSSNYKIMCDKEVIEKIQQCFRSAARDRKGRV